jgi:MSHA biogenesis protein MshQ
MGNFTMNQSGLIRSNALLICCISMLMSSVTLAEEYEGEFNESCEESSSVKAEFSPIVYSGAGVTMGAHSNVFGNIQSVAATTLGEAAELHGNLLVGAAVTLDKDGFVSGDITAGEAATIGAISSVRGNLSAGTTVFIGAESQISGDLKSGGDAKLGAGASVGGNATARTSVTLGAHAQVGGDGIGKPLSNVRAFTGPIVLGLNAAVNGDATPGTIISYGMNASVRTEYQDTTNLKDFTNEADGPVATKKAALTQKQKELADRIEPAYNELATTINSSREFVPGIYHASALTTSAGITLTFRGTGYESEKPDEWFINTDTYTSFGANLTVEVHNAAPGSTIVFNAGSYTTIGANSTLIGTIFAGTYITTGENTTIEGIGLDCGGMFATNGAVTLGAGSTVGSYGCWVEEQPSEGNNEVENDADDTYFYSVFDPNALSNDYEEEGYYDDFEGDGYYDDYEDGYYDDFEEDMYY